MAHTWVPHSAGGPVPPLAVVGGHDCDGSTIYVGRALHEGDRLAAKVIPASGSVYVAWGGSEHWKAACEVLVGSGYGWQQCSGGSVPANAVSSGTTCSGEPLYVGRGRHANSLTVGKVHPTHGCLYIPFGGKEVRLDAYEVLVSDHGGATTVPPPHNEEYKWIHSSAGSAPPQDAIVGGNDVDGDVIYVGRSFHNGDMLVAKVIPAKGAAYVGWRGEEVVKQHFEVLCGHGLAWRPCHDHVIPPDAVVGGRTAEGHSLYVGRGHYEGSLTVGGVSAVQRALFIPFGGAERRLEVYDILVRGSAAAPGWAVPPPPPPPPSPPSHKPPLYPELVPPPFGRPPLLTPPVYRPPLHRPPPHDLWLAASVSSGHIPPNAVQAGHDSDMSAIFVCRAFHQGDLLPGKLIPSRLAALVPFQGQEVRKENFEVLVGEGYQWVPATAGLVRGAVEAGHTAAGEPLYVGRAHYRGTLTPGKVLSAHQCLYIPFHGQEVPLTNYEILVRPQHY